MHENYNCAICGEQYSLGQCWFLVAESHWQDKLTIFRWNDQMAAQPGVYHSCGSEHVRELVVHWMATGRLDYPIARTSGWEPADLLRHEPIPPFDPRGAEILGELSVDRESIGRILSENPHSLRSILDGLQGSLQSENREVAPDLGPPIARWRLSTWEV